MSAIDSFGMLDSLGSNVIIHIPHGNTEIPNNIVYTKDIQSDIDIHTDWGTIDIFNTDDHTVIIYPYSRYFCDVERLENDTMESVGMGIYYTKNLKGETIRDESYKSIVINSYNIHHNKLSTTCQNIVDIYGSAIIIDAHSFGNDIVDNPNNIDICLGFNDNISNNLKQYTIEYFKKHGFCVGVNDPYGGAIVPKEYENNNRVQSIMIEINKSIINCCGLKNIISIYINNVNMYTI
jgi:N-formylglutamate amidohydrolase